MPFPAAPWPRPERPIGGPAAWTGAELRDAQGWRHTLAPAEAAELLAAAQRAQGVPLPELGAGDFALPRLDPVLARLREDVLRGRGFALLRGLPVERCDRAASARMFWAIGTRIGRGVSQNAAGHLLGHVTDLGYDAADPKVRLYQTRERQGFHTDSADVVALLCLRTAREGGLSRIASAAAVHDALLERAPECVGALFEPFCTDHRGEYGAGQTPWFEAPVLHWHAGLLSVLYQRRYIESAQRFPEVPRLTPRQIAALDAWDAALDDPALHLDMELAPGDVQLVNNHALVHDRTAFVDGSEPDKKRHLLRLWLCPPDGRPLPQAFAGRYGRIDVGDRGGVHLSGVPLVAPLDPR
jgi:hypothetical protein